MIALSVSGNFRWTYLSTILPHVEWGTVASALLFFLLLSMLRFPV